MSEFGKCFQDKEEINIILDTTSGMFQAPRRDGVTPMTKAEDFMRILLGYIHPVREAYENVRIFVGDQDITTSNRTLSYQFERAMVNVREGRKRPYTILKRRQRAGSLRAVKYIVLTDEHSKAPARLKRQTLVLDFCVLSNESFSPITYMSHYAHVKSNEIEKAARHVLVTNVLPFCLTTIVGARPMIGNMYARMECADTEECTDSHLMTVPQISIIGVGSADMFRDLECVGTGVFASWPKDFTTGVFTFARDGLLAVPREHGGYEEAPMNTMYDDLTGIHEISASLLRSPQKQRFLIGQCKEMMSHRNFLVVFRPSGELIGAESPFDPEDWRTSQDMLVPWDTCDFRVHDRDRGVGEATEGPNFRQNWNYNCNTIRFSFYEWTDNINLNQSEDFFPNTGLSVLSFLAYSSSVVCNPFLMLHLLKFVYECRNDNQTITFFDRPMLRGLQYNEEHRLMLQNLCLEAVRDIAFERALRVVNIQEDADQLFAYVIRRLHVWVD